MDPVAQHYQVGTVGERILEALEKAGKDRDRLTPSDLAPVDEFHIRGREATEELARIAELDASTRVLDVGCGIGGSCRYLATTFGCEATGLDVTPEYVETARMLSSRVGLAEKTDFREGSALELPFDGESFDAVWTEHVQMNIAAKRQFYGEIARVLRPGGKFLFHDVFAGEGGDVHFPVPWAETAEISHLARPGDVREILGELGFGELQWQDKTEASNVWFRAALDRMRAGERPLVGIHLLMGKTAPVKLQNMARNLEDGRVAVVQAALTR